MMQRVWLLSVFLLALTGCVQSDPPIGSSTPDETPSEVANTQPVTPSASQSSTVSAAADPDSEGDLAQLLQELEIQPEQQEGYDRDLFQHWIDADADGCNARREVLIAEAVIKPEISGGCDIFGGEWYSLYDGVLTNDPSSFDIDHVVPLKEAWDSGAYQWSSSTRKAFANDLVIPETLIAVTASSNRSKSDRDPAQWLPANQKYLCEYTKAWLIVKTRWQLTIDSAEALALGTLVSNCSIVRAEAPPLAAISFGTAPTKGANGEDPRFDSCREAMANGYGPYTKGIDIEYDWYRDGDKDGTVCE
jgi:hypothetical protein